MVLLKEDNMDADKPVPVVNIPHVRFIGGPTSDGITGRIQISWDPEKSVSVINTSRVTVDE